MRNTRWIYKNNSLNNKSNLNIDKDIIELLHNRGITDDQEIPLLTVV